MKLQNLKMHLQKVFGSIVLKYFFGIICMSLYRGIAVTRQIIDTICHCTCFFLFLGYAALEVSLYRLHEKDRTCIDCHSHNLSADLAEYDVTKD